MKVYNDYLEIEVIEQNKSPGGVVMPETVKKRFKKAKVLTTQQSREEFPAKGEIIVYDSLGQLETFNIGGREVQMIYIKQVVAGVFGDD